MAGRSCALFALSASVLAGCITPAQRFPLGPEVPAPFPDAVPESVPEAYFILHAADVRAEDWPQAYERYDLLVCSPSIPAETVARIRADLPEAVLLAYWNSQDLPLGNHTGNPYWDAFEAVFDSSLCLTNLDTGGMVRVQGYDGTPGSGLPQYVFRPEIIEIVVAFHRDVTMAAGWDGMYLDQTNAVYPNWRRATVLAQTTNFDVDGDGLADRIDDVAAQWAANRPLYTQRLREVLGGSVCLVANSGGALGDPALNGITLEGVGSRFTADEGRSHLIGQRAVSMAPFTAVLWATTPESSEPSRLVAEEFPGVHWGYVAE